MEELEPFYLPERDQPFTETKCFLCGKNLNADNSSVEHVFPKWIQAKFNLWDKRLTLQNGTAIPYRKLTIPCCKSCNSEHLSNLEEEVASKFKEGYEGFKELDEHKLFLWLSKIFYGILFKELLLPANVRDYNGKRMHTQEQMEQYNIVHMLLQGTRVPMTFSELNPWSIFVFNSQTSGDNDLNFDFRDNLFGLTLGIRIGEISIIAVLQDNGAQAEIFKTDIETLKQLKLHPRQFEEIFSKVTYKQLTLKYVPKFLIEQCGNYNVNIRAMRLGGGSPVIYNEWSNEEFSHILAFHTGVPQDKLFVEPDGVMTYLYNEDNTIQHIEVEGFS